MKIFDLLLKELEYLLPEGNKARLEKAGMTYSLNIVDGTGKLVQESYLQMSADKMACYIEGMIRALSPTLPSSEVDVAKYICS